MALSTNPDTRYLLRSTDATGEIGTLDVTTFKIGSTTVDATATEINRVADVSARVVNLTASTLSVTEASHDSKIITVNRAAGSTLTLPAATGSGARIKIFVGTTITSNNLVVQVTGNDTMKGTCWMANDSDATVSAFETANDSDTITMNGSTKGGIIGDIIELEDVATDVWSVQIFCQGTGSEATPFSAAV